MNILIASIVTLGIIGCVSAVILYFVAKKFKVEEDPRIDEVESVLPGANCGGCGYPGCRGFADACVKSETLEGKLCPVGGQPVMAKVADILGMAVTESTPKVAVVRCNGTCSARPKTSNFDGTKSCAITVQLYGGETGCTYGCLGYGDCVEACAFDAIHINAETGLPEVDEEKCTACGACVKACPKHVIELRNKGPKNRRVYVSCINRDRGAVARKVCTSACIGCGKCAKACPFGAITIENNLAYIDYEKCKLCRKCVVECPTGAIHDVNFPTPAKKSEPAVKTVVEEIKPQAEIKVQVEAKPQAEPHTPADIKPQTSQDTQEKQQTNVADLNVNLDAQQKPSTEVVIEKVEVASENKTQEKEITNQPVQDNTEKFGEKEVEKAPETTKEDVATTKPQETLQQTEKTTEEDTKPQAEAANPVVPNFIPDDIDVKSLIPEELRVRPREKAKEVKPEPAADKQIEQAKLDF